MKQTKTPVLLLGILAFQTVGLLIYTAIAIQNDGFNFLAKANEFVMSMTWMGQFTLDFQCYLILSAMWVAWRNGFSNSSLIIALIALVLGIVFFAPYLIYLIVKEQGDLVRVLVGAR